MLRIKELAKEQRYSLRKLAELTSTRYATLYRLANNKADKADLALLKRIAELLGVKVGDLFNN